MQTDSILIRAEFWGLIAVSLALPVGIIWHLIRVVRLSRRVLIAYSVVLLGISGLDVVLIRAIAALAIETTSLADDKIFHSEFSLALYLLPLACAGVGTNLLTYAITRHLRLRTRGDGNRPQR